MNDHDQIRSLLSGIAAGTLAPDDALRAHLATCAACAEELERLRRVVAAVERLPQPELSAALLARLKSLAIAHREAVLERRWNRLVL
ncbi:MAG: anti-sigma factor family protein, partial [Candidatus Acidiferrales bacterium]